jgi:hypothetical protein
MAKIGNALSAQMNKVKKRTGVKMKFAVTVKPTCGKIRLHLMPLTQFRNYPRSLYEVHTFFPAVSFTASFTTE